MNYLAHLYLAGQEEELITGNFIADSVKGSHYKNYPERITAGIMMHRATDFFSDTHPVYLRSVHRLAPQHGKFSGVITDMFFDYLLAANWKDFSAEPLAQFSNNIYALLHKYREVMPEKSRIILEYMNRHNWLLSYRTIEGIRRALRGMSQRMKYYHPMHNAVTELETNIEPYRDDFYNFFPLLEEYTRSFRNNI